MNKVIEYEKPELLNFDQWRGADGQTCTGASDVTPCVTPDI